MFNINNMKGKYIDAGVTSLLYIWLCCVFIFIFPNQGGAGLALPQNLLAWSFMALISLWCLFYFPATNKIVLPAGTWLLLSGVFLWSLPLLWSPRADWRLDAVPRVLALWGMAGFYILLLCTTSCYRLRSRWLFILVLAALIQAIYAVWQFAHIRNLAGGRPYGSFQQVNVLASFIATGLACALRLFWQTHQRTVRNVAASALILLPAILTVLQSRAGQLGALLAVLLLNLLATRHQNKRPLSAILLMVLGVVIGIAGLQIAHHVFPNFQLLIDKDHSTFSRVYMLKLTWQIIQLHPLAGNGYGSFEALFGQLAQLTPPGLEAATVRYPHNELLYAWVEGGIVAVAGILLIVASIIKRLWSQGGAGVAGIALLLPLAVHINLEYPLYQSMTHGITLIMLLVVCGGTAKKEVVPVQPSARRINRVCRAVAGVMAMSLLLFMLTGLQTQQRITEIEQQGLMPLATSETAVMASLLNPYSQFTRLDFDRHVALLLKFNLTQDPALLDEFRVWAEAWLQLHNDPSVYESLLRIAQAQHSPEQKDICERAHGRWLSHSQFRCDK